MQASEAVRQIRDTIFKPGWSFSASAVDEYKIRVYFTIHTVDTSYVDAVGNFYAPKTLSDDFTMDVSALDEQGLCYQLLKVGMMTNFHEDREFMQVRQPDGTFRAPLHPHTYDGEVGWQRLGGSKGMTPNDDLDEFSLSLLRMQELYAAVR